MIWLKFIERFMKNKGARRVSKDALIEIAEFLERRCRELLIEAEIYARHANRKTIKRKDVKIAISSP